MNKEEEREDGSISCYAYFLKGRWVTCDEIVREANERLGAHRSQGGSVTKDVIENIFSDIFGGPVRIVRETIHAQPTNL